MTNTLRRYLHPEQIRELSLVLIIIIVLLFFSTQIANFISPRFFNRISADVAIIAVVAVGETLVVLTRNVDLSVGSIVGVTAYFVGTFLANNKEFNPVLAVVLAMVLGAGLGMINGALVAYGRVPAIITTLGTLAIYRAPGRIVGRQNRRYRSMPKWLQDLPGVTLASFAGLDCATVGVDCAGGGDYFSVGAVVHQFWAPIVRHWLESRWGAFAGLPSQRVVFFAFVLCGAHWRAGRVSCFWRGLAILQWSRRRGWNLQVIAAVVVGGVAILGGQGTMFGALLGALLINILQQSLIRWVSISAFWIDALLGVLILAAIATDTLIIGRLRKLWARSDVQIDGNGCATHRVGKII